MGIHFEIVELLRTGALNVCSPAHMRGSLFMFTDWQSCAVFGHMEELQFIHMNPRFDSFSHTLKTHSAIHEHKQ